MRTIACSLLPLVVVACSKKGDDGGAANQPVTIEATLQPSKFELLISIKAHVMADVTLVEPNLSEKDSFVRRDGGGAFSLKIPLSALPASKETTLRLRAQRPGHTEFAETTLTYTRSSECRFAFAGEPMGPGQATSVKCEGIEGSGGITRPLDGRVSIVLAFPAGSSFTFDGKTTSPPDGKFTASIDAWPITRALTPDEVNGTGTTGPGTYLDFPVSVTTNGQTYELPFQLPTAGFMHGAHEVYARAAKGKPGLFPGEAAVAKGKPPTSIYQGLKIAGSATRADEVDLVATMDVRVRSKSCGSFASADGRQRGTVKVEMTDWVATVRDRRTGRKLGTKTFAAPSASCPDSIQGGGGAMSTGGTSGDEAAAQAFIDSFWKP